MNNGVNTNQTNASQQNVQTNSNIVYGNQVPQQPVMQQPVVQQQTQQVVQQPVVQQPVIQQTYPAGQTTQQPVIVQTQPVEQPELQPEQPKEQKETPKVNQEQQTQKPKKKSSIAPLLFLIILILGGYIVYSSKTHKSEIDTLNYNCTAVTASKEEVKLDLNSTLVQGLYSKVKTTIREDIAEPNFNDSMKRYLAYRQVVEKEKYDSNCNLYDSQKMEPFKCEISLNFVPKAFKVEAFELEYKKLFGEKSQIPYGNIQLGRSCIGGYQYIEQRGEFVQGYCSQDNATSFSVDKKLVEATSTRNIVILKEEVKYHENEKMSLPDILKSGYYYYTFRLDLNYNYVLVSKEYQSKY